ncbi:S-formylglutathione hydrolase [Pseudoalteromonas ruthenica]|uniref:S-formylglutathione hydrolase n=1 Tax=Pseudoalteromonas ruthenica TaxID=151081 RepID=A0A5S3Z7U8_9GAMM|nr:S-formylglutathione hydrolase [Pseudoalteromonas ruthenica]TMP88288.1 S-formylglutathione hydrolase [Pseudoalteromonas ruthenica]
MSLELISKNKVHGGWHKRYRHESAVNNCTMTFAIYLPPGLDESQRAPVLYWLSGLTCSDENFMQKAAAFKSAAELGLIIVAADTSPRGEQVADDKEGAYDFGLGAGFYVNATQAPYDQHYQMYDYINEELPALINEHFPVSGKQSISGHSMGGHGALVLGLRNSDKFASISAFAPIASPTRCPWGEKALTGYLGNDKQTWREYDSSLLLAETNAEQCPPLLISQGLADDFLQQQLKPELLQASADEAGIALILEQHPGYDHSYFFISSFIDQHLRFHAKHLA